MEDENTYSDKQEVVLRVLNTINAVLTSLTIFCISFIMIKFRKLKEVRKGLIILFYVICLIDMVTLLISIIHRIIYVDEKYLVYQRVSDPNWGNKANSLNNISRLFLYSLLCCTIFHVDTSLAIFSGILDQPKGKTRIKIYYVSINMLCTLFSIYYLVVYYYKQPLD